MIERKSTNSELGACLGIYSRCIVERQYYQAEQCTDIFLDNDKGESDLGTA